MNEENAAGGRVVTAPTNGAAGIVPAVLHYYRRFDARCRRGWRDLRFLLTAGAIGILYKQNASISGAEVGCQGEVGVACSMAAGGPGRGAAAARPGRSRTPPRSAWSTTSASPAIRSAGLVQIPCIERNAMGAVKAINAGASGAAGRRHSQGHARPGDRAPCARPAATCHRSTRRHRRAALR